MAYHIGPLGVQRIYFYSSFPPPPFPPCPARGAHIYAYAYICTPLPSAFVTFSFSHKAPIRVHLRAKTPPCPGRFVRLPFTFFPILFFFLSSISRATTSEPEGKKSTTYGSDLSFAVYSDGNRYRQEERNNHVRSETNVEYSIRGWGICIGSKKIEEGETGGYFSSSL